MRRELVANITAEFAGRAFHAVVAGLLLVFLTRRLGPESYGLFALAVSIFAVSRLFSELGIAPSAARYVAEFKEKRAELVDTIVTESRTVIVVTAVTVALVLAASAEWIATILEEPALVSVILIGSFSVLFRSLHRYNRILLQGFEKVALSAKLHALEAALTGAFVVGFVVYRPTAWFAVLGYAVGFGAVAIVGYFALNSVRSRTNANGTSRAETAASRGEIRNRILRYSVPLTVTRFSDVVDREVDILLVGYFLNPLSVAYYMIGKELSRLVSIPAASVGFALSPSYGADKAAGNLDAAASVYEESLKKVLTFYVPACTGIFLVADVAIPSVFGAEYAGAIPVVRILALFIFFEGLVKISSNALDFLGRARTRAVVKFLTSIANFVLNLLFIPLVGVEGAAIATVITHGLYSLATVYFVHVELSFDHRSVGRSLGRVTLVAVVMGVVVSALLQAFAGYVAMAVGIATGTAIWIFGCQLLGLLDYRSVATIGK